MLIVNTEILYKTKGIDIIMKKTKKLLCLCICFMTMFSFSLVAFADTCESQPVITSTTGSCTGNTCYKAGVYSPHYKVLQRGYYRCFDSYGTPYTKPYSNEYNNGCC